MMKKIGIITALFTIIFGGLFASTAGASASDQGQQNSYKIYYSINEVQKHLSGNEFLQKLLSQHQELDWNNHKQDKEQNTAEEDKAATEDKEQNAAEEAPAATEEQEQNAAEEEPAVTEEQEQNAAEEAPAVTEEQEQNTAEEEQVVTEEEEQNNESSTEELSQFEQEVVDLTNEERSKHGLQALQIDTELSEVAREKSRDMAASNYFDHNSPNYGSPFDMMQQFGISYQTAGENIAKGQRSPQEVVNAWMNSEGHRANILNGNFTHIGVGFIEQGNHWTQMFIGK